MKCETRTLEMGICWSDFTWSEGHYVDIPFDTPEDQVEEVGRSTLLGRNNMGNQMSITHCWLYCDSVEEIDY